MCLLQFSSYVVDLRPFGCWETEKGNGNFGLLIFAIHVFPPDNGGDGMFVLVVFSSFAVGKGVCVNFLE